MSSSAPRSWLLLTAAGALAIGCADRTTHSQRPDAALAPVDAGPAPVVETALATSPSHTCALRQAGLYCWGNNFAGQLGTGGTTDSDTPVRADVDVRDAVAIALGTARTCLRRSTGAIVCWGLNSRAQIGDGTRMDSLTAVTVPGIDDARALAIDDSSTCVLHADRTVSCWGGSPGAAPNEGSLTPQPVADLFGVVQLAAGALGSYCALGEDTVVRCWRLKNGAWTKPFAVDDLTGARAIALTGQDEVCAITPTSEIVCHNFDSANSVPLDDSYNSLELVAAGGLAACARNTEGSWHCWNVLPPMLESVGSPAIVLPSDIPLRALAISGFRVCALRADGNVACANAADGAPQLRVVEGLPL